jgi:hypothetical protein
MNRLPIRRVALLGALVPLLALVLGAAPAYAAGGHLLAPSASILGTLTSPIASVFSAIGGAVFGAFSWTVSLASKFILVTLASFVRMLIPRSWANDAVQVFDWIVAIPNYAGTVTGPGGGRVYGFAGVNDMRQLFQWLGIGLLPLTLVYSTSRAMLGRGDHVATPLARVVMLAGLLLFYPYLWEQGAALTNQLSSIILSPAAVIDGIHKLMAYATEGVALGGWQLIDLSLMAALALELLALIFVKVVLILLGALLFATGPLMIGLVATESGDVIARAWVSAVVTFLMLPVAWAAVFAVGAVLIGDAGTAGPLIGGSSQVGNLLGGVIVAVAGAATLWLCLKAAREVGGLLRLQLGGLLVVAGRARSRSNSTPATTGGGSSRGAAAAGSIRNFQSKVRTAGAAAVDAAGPRTAAGAGALGTIGRRGLVISGANAAGSAAVAARRLAGRSSAGTAARRRAGASATAATIATGAPSSRAGRAGAVAARMARNGTAAWQQHDRHPSRPAARAGRRASPHTRDMSPGDQRSAPTPTPTDPQRPAPASAASPGSSQRPGQSQTHARNRDGDSAARERASGRYGVDAGAGARAPARSAPASPPRPHRSGLRVSTPPATHRTRPQPSPPADREPASEPARPQPYSTPRDQNPSGRD